MDNLVKTDQNSIEIRISRQNEGTGKFWLLMVTYGVERWYCRDKKNFDIRGDRQTRLITTLDKSGGG